MTNLPVTTEEYEKPKQSVNSEQDIHNEVSMDRIPFSFRLTAFFVSIVLSLIWVAVCFYKLIPEFNEANLNVR